MKGSLHHANTQKFYSFLPLKNTNHPLRPCQSRVLCNITVPWTSLGFKVSHFRPNHASCLVQQRAENGFLVQCASWGSGTELERELEAEMNTQEDEEEKTRVGMARFRHKCGERKGVVELLECLEREAIMGEDVGKEPTDYNRRAQIFDRSSRIFQGLKERKNDVLSDSPQNREK